MTNADKILTGRSLVGGSAQGELLFADVGLSFWGGVNSLTGDVIDQHHPLAGKNLAGRVLAIPSGRGSCTGSSVMMELISSGHAPAALILAEVDEILTLGVLLAEMIYERSIPVISIGKEAFESLRGSYYARVSDESVRTLSSLPLDDFAPSKPNGTLDFSAYSIVLSDEDRKMLAGDQGKAAQVAMQVVLKMADLQGAGELINVTQAHIDGCIYTGPASLKFAEQFVEWGAKVVVPTTLNSISVDQRRWKTLGVDPAFGEPASAVGSAYMAMGARMSYTCAPYLLESAPKAGEQIVWAESNAVVYANSVLAARTLKYPDYLDICIAITGRAPLSGCHLDEHRKPQLKIQVALPDELDDAFYPLLGYHVGLLAGKRIPLVFGLEGAAPTLDNLKAFSAAFGTTSGAPLFHIAGVTPEALDLDKSGFLDSGLEQLTIALVDLVQSWNSLNSAREARVDIVTLGNPHFSLTEFKTLAELCKGLAKAPDTAMVITCGRAIYEQAIQNGYIAEIERFGAQIVNDTCWCMLGEPVIPPTAKNVMTNSAKFAHYAPGLVGRPVHFASLAGCVEAASKGRTEGAYPAWLRSLDNACATLTGLSIRSL
ncbi:aconitase X [Pseudomonas viridiflava]|uniref:cis-3-hydroxy-L-proline dehydratase n=5 Tax=Pseudomonas viridiflava TaxID=33069 RepID=UPI000F0412E1|nr:aconitase family protein [Pseudomonas viridiflava]